jgi:hypothetical protein
LDIRKEKRLTILAMYKYPTTFTLSDSKGQLSKSIQSFKTENDFLEWQNYKLMNGWKIIDEFDFKQNLREYIIEKFGQQYFIENYL